MLLKDEKKITDHKRDSMDVKQGCYIINSRNKKMRR